MEADAAEPNGQVVLSNIKREGKDSCRAIQPNVAKKQKRSSDLDAIDLEDVPPQTPILKNILPREYVDNTHTRTAGKSSNYLGIYWD